jgi:hypothetical protein
MNECHLAAGDTLTLARLPALSWEVTRRWQSVGDDLRDRGLGRGLPPDARVVPGALGRPGRGPVHRPQTRRRPDVSRPLAALALVALAAGRPCECRAPEVPPVSYPPPDPPPPPDPGDDFPPTWFLLRPLPARGGPPASTRMRRALKVLLRAFGIRAVEMSGRAPPGPTRPVAGSELE